MRIKHLSAALAIAAAASALAAGAAQAQGGVCSSSSPQYCPAPSVATGPASSITNTSATLTGAVIPNGADTQCTFGYGTSDHYSAYTPFQDVGSGTSGVAVSASISGLQSSTTFHYQLLCTSAGGSGFGGDKTFTTTDNGPSRLAIPQHAGFVNRHGVVGFVVACFGDRACVGKLTLTRHGRSLAPSANFHIASETTRVVFVKLGHKSRSRLRHSKHGLKARVNVSDSDGKSASRKVTLHRWT